MPATRDQQIIYTEDGLDVVQIEPLPEIETDTEGIFCECFLLNGFLQVGTPAIGIDPGPLAIAIEGINNEMPDMDGVQFGQVSPFEVPLY